MIDIDKIILLFVTIGYFLVTEHLLCKIERLKKENKLLEDECIDLRSEIFFKDMEEKEGE